MSFRGKTDRYHLQVAVGAIIVLIVFGTILFHFLEGLSFAQSFYFSVVTLTTIGYGDFHPTTDFSRVVTAIYILIGVGTTFTAITVIATDRINKFANSMRNRADARKEEDNTTED